MDSHHEVDIEPIFVLHLETSQVDDVKLKNIQVEREYPDENIWETRGIVGCISPFRE